MKFLHNRSSFISNESGLIKFCMTFSLGSVIDKSSRSIFIYKHDLHDLIEINYTNELVITTNFDGFRPNLGNTIEENWAFFEGYFNSANLKNRKFIFDTSLKLPIRYSDFGPVNKNTFSSKETLFVMDNKKEGYITDNINIFISIENTRYLDNCILAAVSEQKNICKPLSNNKSKEGLLSTAIIAGLLTGVKKDDLEKNISSMDVGSKVSLSLNEMNLDSELVKGFCKELKTDKLYNLLFSAVSEKNNSEFSGESVNASRIASMGLDNFIKTIKDFKKKIRVNMDVYFGVKSMYIINGAAFVELSLGSSLEGIQELFMSEEIYCINSIN